MKRPVFTPGELKWLQESSPEALRSLVLYHEVRAVEADAMGYPESVAYHDKRASELKAVADFVAAAHEQGDPAQWED